MRAATLLSIFLIIILFSACRSATDTPAKQAKTDLPEPLEETEGDVISFKNDRSGGNMVDAIYIDLVKRKPDLQSLEDRLGKFNASKEDSLQAFNNYKSKVASYYASANQILENIQDTVLKARLKILLAAGKNSYHQKANNLKI